MSDQALDPEELEAIQAAIRQAAPTPAAAAVSAEVTALTLLASDRDTRSARPRLADVAGRWARRLGRALQGFVDEVAVDVMATEIVDAAALGDELRTMWTALATVDDRGAIVIAIGGSVVEGAAARRCGARAVKAGERTRDPSPLALRLFAPAGDAAFAAFEQAWTEVERGTLTRAPAGRDDLERALGDGMVLAATLAISGEVNGRVRLLARPDLLTRPEAPASTVPTDRAALGAALGGVTVEVRVDLGTITIPLAELGRLAPGSELVLPTFVDEPLPIYCGDVLKAWGRPVVTRGVLAVEIAALAIPGGGRP